MHEWIMLLDEIARVPAALRTLGSRDGQLGGAVTAAGLTAPLAQLRPIGLGCATPGCRTDASCYRTDLGTPACAARLQMQTRLDGGLICCWPFAAGAHREVH